MNAKDLKDIGLKVTLPRLRVLAILETSENHHMGVEEIYRQLILQNQEVGIATIYRILTQFEKSGIVNKLNFENDKYVYEISNIEHHDHLICVKCGKIDEFTDDTIEKCQLLIADKFNYKLTDHSLHLYGLCAKCQ